MWPPALSLVDVTAPTLADHLAWDFAQLDAADRDASAGCLRFWEAEQYGVVVGRSNLIDREVDQAACAADAVPVHRRHSGGGAVVVGPGCLCYTLILPIPDELPQLGISGVTQLVMQRLADALTTPDCPIHVQGISDLVWGDRKIGGNAQRWKRQAFLHHGTILYDFDLDRISRYLRSPSRQPEYRQDRSHDEFVANVPLNRDELISRLRLMAEPRSLS